MDLSATNRDLFVVALRVWTRFNGGMPIDSSDVEALKSRALPEERRLRIDALACTIIQRELTNRIADAG
jgi:hypothetical protein